MTKVVSLSENAYVALKALSMIFNL
jgi:hypothetical protein